jgi:8-amino-7-oxononanoate synthase
VIALPDDDPHGFGARLAALDAAGLRRRRRVVQTVAGPRVEVQGRALLSFSNNDYLGLAQHPALIAAAQAAAARYGVGASASALVCGHSAAHEALELFFGSGYLANVGVIPAIVGRGDLVFSDALNHACLIDGARLSGAEIQVFPHGNVAALDAMLRRCPGSRRKLVIVDAVFSMDGDVAPLPALLALCERHDALLMIDDAHGFGVLGPQGRGTAAHFGLVSSRLLVMATLGKAAGVAGAFVAGSEPMIEWLLQRARSYIFATAAPAMVVQALRASLRLIETESWRRERLTQLVGQLRAGLTAVRWPNPPSTTAIQPLIVGDNRACTGLMEALLAQGVWVPAIRPPTVPEGTARLRISLTAAHTPADVARLVQALVAATEGALDEPNPLELFKNE